MRGIDVTTYRPADHQPDPEPEGPVVTEPDPDYEGWSDEDVAAEAAKANAEDQRRKRLARAKQTAKAANLEWAAAAGRKDGDKWEQPTGAHDAYPEGAEVVHDGTTWASLIDANVWEPGVSGWREVPGEDEDGEPTVPAWVQPTGAHDAYNEGDQVTHDGQTWTSDLDGNVWEPGVHGWTALE